MQILSGKMEQFIQQMTKLVDAGAEEPELLSQGAKHLGELVAKDDWLPESCTLPDPQFYRQYLLYCDPQDRFSVVSFVWGPGQKTPIHDHTVWGLIGMLRGAEIETSFTFNDGELIEGATETLSPGMVGMVSPTIGDVHRVANALEDQVSISIHVYGADIGKVNRHVFTEQGEVKPFVSGYSNSSLPDFN